MAEGYGSGAGETTRVEPVLKLKPRETGTTTVETATDTSGGDRRDGRKKGKREKGKNKNKPRVVLVTQEQIDRMREEARAKASGEPVEAKPIVMANIDDLPELGELEDLREYSDGEEPPDGINSPKDLAVAAGTAAATAGAVTYGLVKTGLFHSAGVAMWKFVAAPVVAWKSLPWIDRLGRKLDSWGDSLLKKADLPFPFGPLAEATAGIMDWTTGKILSKESLADLLKKEAEEKKKAQEKAFKQHYDGQVKFEKKKDDAAKKEKDKKDKQALLEAKLGKESAQLIMDAIESGELTSEGEPKAEEPKAAA